MSRSEPRERRLEPRGLLVGLPLGERVEVAELREAVQGIARRQRLGGVGARDGERWPHAARWRGGLVAGAGVGGGNKKGARKERRHTVSHWSFLCQGG